MRIKNFIKNYPMTFISIFVLLTSILGILIQSKVYALTAKNTPGCGCLTTRCTTLPPIDPDCYINQENNCECGFTSFKVCTKDTESHCEKIYSSGCGCENCSESDCTNPPCNPGCGDCITIRIVGCKGVYPSCGECEVLR